MNEEVVVATLARLLREGLSRHDAIHAIGSVRAANIYDVVPAPEESQAIALNEVYAADLKKLPASAWRKSG